MKVVIDWVLAQRYRLILLAIALAPLLPFVATALLALETARRGAQQGLTSAAIGVAGMLLLAVVSGINVVVFTVAGAIWFLAGVAIGALLLRAGTLGLAFQGTVLFCFLFVALVSLLGLDAGSLFGPALDELVALLRERGASEEQIELVQGRGGMMLLIVLLFAQLVGALLLAYWWLGLAHGDARFGTEFRRLKLGRVLGLPATILLGLGLVFDAALVQNLTALAVLGFLLQGFAVMHAWAYARQWHPGFLAPVYVLLVTPLVVVVFFGLSAVGLLDTWFNLRAPLRSQL